MRMLAGHGLLSRGMLLRGHALASSVSPLALFAGGVVGVWFDPSDHTTLFEDVAGTIPATLPGQPVGLMLDKSKGLVLGPQVITAAGWVASGPVTFTASGLQVVCSHTGSTPASQTSQPLSVVAGKAYEIEGAVSTGAGSTMSITIRDSADSATSAQLAAIAASSAGAAASGKIIYTATTTGTVYLALRLASGTTERTFTVSIRELPGHHATQPVAASRPTLARHPKGGRRNLLNSTEDFANAAWSKFTGGTGVAAVVTPSYAAAPDGSMTACRVQLNLGAGATGSDFSGFQQSLTPVLDMQSAASLWVKTTDGSTKAVSLRASTTGTIAPVSVSGSWQRLTVTEAATMQLRITLRGTHGTDAAADLLIWHPQLETGTVATAYQKVTSQYDVTEAGVPDCWGLMFDGVDDFMVTPAIDLTGTGKVGVFAGVRKLSDATFGYIVGQGDATSTNGAWDISASSALGANRADYRGQLYNGAATTRETLENFAAPVSNVVSVVLNFAGPTPADKISLRVNGNISHGALAGDSAVRSGFLNAPIHIGGRIGTSAFASMILNQLIVAGKLPSAAEITNTETFLNSKMGAY